MKPHQLNQIINYQLVKICIAALLCPAFSSHVLAQEKVFFINNHGNPLKNFSIPFNKESHPFFADIDADGDLDCFSGEYSNEQFSKIYFYRNNGNKKNPSFELITGPDNP